MNEMIFYIADYAVILPAAFMCILPVFSHSKIKKALLIVLISVCTAAAAVILGLVRYYLNCDPNIPLMTAIIPALIAYVLTFDVRFIKLWYIFLSTMAVFSFGGLSTHFVQAIAGNSDSKLLVLAIKWSISLTFLAAEVIFIKKLRWLFDNDYTGKVWNYVWLVPLIIVIANFMMIPKNPSIVLVGRLFELYIFEELLLTVFFIVFLLMLYIISKAITDKAESEQNARLLKMQAAQYENLKTYLENTSRMRHDFIFMAKTAQKLAAEGKTEALTKFLEDYGVSIDKNNRPHQFCKHTALNAITAYYADEAEKRGIDITIRLNVPGDISVSDYELCSIVGNILDNAVAAAGSEGIKNPAIMVAAETKPNGDIYIAVSNSFTGRIERSKNKFASTKDDGHGIGLESVKAIVEKNNGYCNFRYDKSKFYSEIMLKQDA